MCTTEAHRGAATDRPATGRGIDGSAGGLHLPARRHGNGRARGGDRALEPPVLAVVVGQCHGLR